MTCVAARVVARAADRTLLAEAEWREESGCQQAQVLESCVRTGQQEGETLMCLDVDSPSELSRGHACALLPEAQGGVKPEGGTPVVARSGHASVCIETQERVHTSPQQLLSTKHAAVP